MKTRLLPLAACTAAAVLMGGCASGPRSGYATAPAPVYSNAPQYSNQYAQYGQVNRIDVIPAASRTSGAGAVLGAVLGAVVGNQIGAGTGRAVATGAGAVGGAIAGKIIPGVSTGTGAIAGAILGGVLGATVNGKQYYRDTRGYCYYVDQYGNPIYDYNVRC